MGALGEFLNDNCSQVSVVYFSYGYTGERAGRALIGFDFETERVREKIRDSALNRSSVLRHATELSEETIGRIV
ncbi:hypothetical protein MLD52_20540 [Puniceicoccaceae bacterium K14]|nr:hypothetical protein [Puniceicoccaceae bacterium K14]